MLLNGVLVSIGGGLMVFEALKYRPWQAAFALGALVAFIGIARSFEQAARGR